VPGGMLQFTFLYHNGMLKSRSKNRKKKTVPVWISDFAQQKHNTTVEFLITAQNCEKQLLASLRSSVRMDQLGFHWTAFHKTLIFEDFSKIFPEISSLIKI
jgi:hypothetical protein